MLPIADRPVRPAPQPVTRRPEDRTGDHIIERDVERDSWPDWMREERRSPARDRAPVDAPGRSRLLP